MAAGAFAVGSMIMNTIVNLAALALCIQQTFMYSARNDAGELFFDNFSLMAKSVSCFKMFITAYHSVQAKGSEMLALVCLLAFFLHLYAITTHLNMNRRAWARTMIVGMATLMAAGVFLLCRGMVIPKDHSWHTVAIPSIIIFTVLLEGCVLIKKQMKEDGGNQNSLRDLQVTVAEMLIAIYQFVDYVGNAHSPWVAEKILHLVGSGLPVLIGACHVGWIAYKAGIISKVVEWLRKNPPGSRREEEQAPGGAAVLSDGDGDAEGQVGEEGVGIVVAVLA